MRSFLDHNKQHLGKSSHRRVLEQHKDEKKQPELVLAHLRNVYYTEVLAQIQSHISTTKNSVPGFKRFKNIVQRNLDDGRVRIESLLEEGKR